MEFAKWLKENIARAETNATRLAEAINENQPTIQRILSGETKNPRLHIVKKLENYFNSNYEKNTIDLSNNADYPKIRKVDIRLSAGISGYSIDFEHEDDDPIVFNVNWFKKRGYDPNRLIAVKVKGDSMQPYLHASDTVVINTNATNPIDGEVFAINYEGELLIKRMVRDAGIWWLFSDNHDQRKHPKKECSGDGCLIIGRIVHKQSEHI